MAGRIAADHAECRRFARARGVEAAAAHAWRADARLVPGVRPALRVARADGRGSCMPAMRCVRPCPPGHRLVRRDALRHGADRRGASACDLFVSIGTSGAVYPAAGFVQTARYCGAKTLEINLEPSLGSHCSTKAAGRRATSGRLGGASSEVPRAWWREEASPQALLSPLQPDFAIEAAVLVPFGIDLHVQEQMHRPAEMLVKSPRARRRRSPSSDGRTCRS